MLTRLFLLLALVFPSGAGQDHLPSTVKEIRQLYAETQQAIAMMSEEEHLCSRLVTTTQSNLPGSGIRKETVTCYFADYGEDEEEWNPDYRPYFITRKYNVGARKFYEEYLFDGSTGRLIFVFIQGDSSEGGKDETRYYFGPDGLISENIKGDRTAAPTSDTALDMALTLRTAVQAQLSGYGKMIEYW